MPTEKLADTVTETELVDLIEAYADIVNDRDILITKSSLARVMDCVFRPEPPRVAERARVQEGCAACDDGTMPFHQASPWCESGKRNHCTCEVCF